MLKLDPNKLKFRLYNPLVDDLINLDLTQTDGSDPLQVVDYTKNQILKDVENRNNKIYVVTYEGNILAFFTLSMTVICTKNLFKDDCGHNDNCLKEFLFPSLLMGKIGIDKKYRCFGIGKYICLFCMGLAQKTNEKIACTFFVFKTTKSLAEKIYGPKYYFRWNNNTSDKIVWVYRRVL